MGLQKYRVDTDIAIEIVRNLRRGKLCHIVGEDAQGELIYDLTAAYAVEDAFVSYFAKTAATFNRDEFRSACKKV